MNKEVPPYLVLNPVYSLFKKDVMISRTQLYIDLNDDIQYKRIKVPIKIYRYFKDETNIKDYYLYEFFGIGKSFQ